MSFNKKDIVFLISVLIVSGGFFLWPGSIESGAPAKINLDYLTVYEIGDSHTAGQDRSGGSQVCQVGTGNLDGNCPTGTPCSCAAAMQVGYYYRVEFQMSNTGGTTDSFSGYYNDLTNLNGEVDVDNDIWVTDGGSDETCDSGTWSAGKLTWVSSDAGCDLSLSGSEAGQLKFIIKAGTGASNTSGADLYGQEDIGTDSLTAGVEITAAAVETVSCSTEPAQTGFDTLTIDSIFTATSTATTTMSCTYAAGCTLYVKDAGDTSNPGLYNSSASDLIDSATETLAQGTEGYGLQAATTAAGTGNELSVDSAYDKTGNDVGALALTNQTLTSSSGEFDSRETVATFKATVSGLNKPGNYVDTITFECLGN